MDNSSYAPTSEVPHKAVVSVEHPCIVKNLEKGISMLGGSSAIKQVLEPGSANALALNFRPEDPDSRPIMSLNNQTNNVLLRITVPKCIGKRKRGSAEPFIPLNTLETKDDAHHVIQSLQDNPNTCKVESLGTIEQSHIWRSMPDFVYSTQGSQFLSKVKSNILPRDLQSVKQFDMHRSYGRRSTEAIPPPVLSTISFPQQYSYRQSTNTKQNSTSATSLRVPKFSDGQANTKSFMTSVHELEDGYPVGPEPGAPLLTSQSKAIRKLVPILNGLFNQRPIWTRRALINHLPNDVVYDKMRFSLGYIAFVIRAGPWRDCMCRYGVDPRTSPEWRKYQTIMVQIPRPVKDREKKTVRRTDWAQSINRTSHIFTGKLPQSTDGSMWQLCDIEDPQLKAFVDIDENHLRHQCENRFFGWYQNGTFGKIRTTMKAKMDALIEGQILDDSAFDRFLALLPEHLEYLNMSDVEVGNPRHGYLPTPATELETGMAAQYRAFTRYGTNKEIREAQESGQRTLQEQDQVGAFDGENEEDAAFDEWPPQASGARHAAAGEDTNDDLQADASFHGEASVQPYAVATAFEEAWNGGSTLSPETRQPLSTLEPASTPAFEEAWQENADGSGTTRTARARNLKLDMSAC